MNSDFRSASEQVGLKAGDGGFQLDIARNTTLVGAAISSSERAALEGRNALRTGTLDVREVKNTAPPTVGTQAALLAGRQRGLNERLRPIGRVPHLR